MTLLERFKKDLAANKAKTAALTLLAAVGLCFWLPPLLKSGKDSTPSGPSMVSVAKGGTGSVPAPVAAAAVSSTPTGVSDMAASVAGLHELVQTETLLQTPDAAATQTNAFTFRLPPPAPQPETDEAEGSDTRPEAGRIPTPEEAGLKLTGTIQGGSFGSAVVNGSVYMVGDQIPCKDKRTYKLVSVGDRQMTLSRGGKEFILGMKD